MNASVAASPWNRSDIESFRFLGIGIGVGSTVIGTSGNLLTIISVLRNSHLRRSSFNMFIVNLSVIDLLTGLVMMPFNVMGYSLMRWPFSEKACILQAFFYFSCGYTSVVCLISITLNRFLGIVFPDRYSLFFTDNMVRIWIFLSWLIAPAFLLPFLVSSLINSVKGDQLITGWRSDQFLCTFVSMPSNWVQYMQVVRFLFQFLPAIIMSLCYTVMVYYVHKSNRRMDKNSPPDYFLYQQRMQKKLSSGTILHYGDCRSDCECSLRDNLSTTSDSTEKPRLTRSQSVLSKMSFAVRRNGSDVENANVVPKLPAHVQRRHDNENHLVYVSIIICLVFTLLFLPSVVINLIPGNQKFDPRIHMMASNITWLNCSMNPFVYVFFHKGMRREYRKQIKLAYNQIRSALKFT